MPEGNEYDVVVVGGGSAGFSAAVSAGRFSENVALIEAQDVLGGASTTNLVCDFFNAYWDGERFIIGGIFEEVRQRLIGRKALYPTRGPRHEDKIGQATFDPDAYAEEIEIMCRETGVDLYLGSPVVGADFETDGRSTLTLEDETTLEAGVVIDATGDAIVAANSGVPTTFGRDEDDWVQPVTLMYTIGPVDLETLREEVPEAVMYDENVGEYWASLGPVESIHQSVVESIESGELNIGVTQITGIMSIPGSPEEMIVNFGHVEVDDPTDEQQLEEATEKSKRQMEEAVEWLRNNVPGCEDIDVMRVADRVGVRESRQIEGLYKMKKEDVLTGRQFDDVIAQSCSPIDIHKEGEDRDWVVLPKGEHYDIPWRSIVPESGPDNLLVAGRCLSADHYAMGAVRQTASIIAVGEAAGVTASIAAAENIPVRDVNYERVQTQLRNLGAILS